MLTLSKSPFPSLPITVSSLRCNSVAQPDITHQQERQIPALRDSCFMLGITNWIVWGSTIYQSTKMQSCSLLWSSTLILKYIKCRVINGSALEKQKWKVTPEHPPGTAQKGRLILQVVKSPTKIPTAFHLRRTEDTEPVLHTRPRLF